MRMKAQSQLQCIHTSAIYRRNWFAPRIFMALLFMIIGISYTVLLFNLLEDVVLLKEKVFGVFETKTEVISPQHSILNGYIREFDLELPRQSLKLPTPIITLGFPKAGTSTIFEYFHCGGRPTAHYACKAMTPTAERTDKCGKVRRNSSRQFPDYSNTAEGSSFICSRPTINDIFSPQKVYRRKYGQAQFSTDRMCRKARPLRPLRRLVRIVHKE